MTLATSNQTWRPVIGTSALGTGLNEVVAIALEGEWGILIRRSRVRIVGRFQTALGPSGQDMPVSAQDAPSATDSWPARSPDRSQFSGNRMKTPLEPNSF